MRFVIGVLYSRGMVWRLAVHPLTCWTFHLAANRLLNIYLTETKAKLYTSQTDMTTIAQVLHSMIITFL